MDLIKKKEEILFPMLLYGTPFFVVIARLLLWAGCH
jgi:hypothetical protein